MERHLHLNLITAWWLWVFIVVWHNAMKFVVNKWPVLPGFTALVNNI